MNKFRAAVCHSTLSLMSVVSLAAPADDARTAIVRMYHEEDTAAVRGDIAAAMSHYAKTYAAYSPSGRIYTYDTLQQYLERTFPYEKSLKSSSKVVAYKKTGLNQAQVRVKAESVQVLVDPNTQKQITLVSCSLILDNLIYQNKKWLHQKSVLLSSQVTNNGQKVTP